MAEEKVESREISWRQLLPWTELFRFLQLALDAKKVLLAAAGVFLLWLGGSLLSLLFAAGYPAIPPQAGGKYETEFAEQGKAYAWARFKEDRDQWNIMHEATGLGGAAQVFEVADLAQTLPEYELVTRSLQANEGIPAEQVIDRLVRQYEDQVREKKSAPEGLTAAQGARYKRLLGQRKLGGFFASAPWSEYRGPNPFLLVTGQAGVPWQAGHFWEWFAREQAPVVLEPVAKLIRPVVYFFSPRATGFAPRLYFFCLLLWTLVVWSFFGGAIARLAAVQIARGESISLGEALRFTSKRMIAYVMAPLFPLIGVLVLTLFAGLVGLVFLIPIVGDILIGGILWFLFVLFGIGMALSLVGLVGWPLMAATISVEATDSWEAVSRSYGYVYQRPWQFVWNSLVAVTYAGLVIFFIGFLGSFSIYLSKWALAQTPFIQATGREPSFLFIHAPESFGWRTLLLQGVKVEGQDLVQDGKIDPAAYTAFTAGLRWWNFTGARITQFWLIVIFLLMLGIGYSLFWCEVTVIYMLLRRDVEGAELDEVHQEDEDLDGSLGNYMPQPPPAPQAAPRPGGLALATIDPPPPAAPATPAPLPVPPASPPVTDVPPPS